MPLWDTIQRRLYCCRAVYQELGCKIRNLYYRAFGFADDVSFVAPSIDALHQDHGMFDIILNCASGYDFLTHWNVRWLITVIN